jgi:hypothetical protein
MTQIMFSCMPVRNVTVVKSYLFLMMLCIVLPKTTIGSEPIRAAHFLVDATPPIGSVLAYTRVDAIETPLRCHGLILCRDDEVVVLLTLDWIGIANDGYRFFRDTIANRLGIPTSQIAIHTGHQHDAVWCDLSTDRLLQSHQVPNSPFDSEFAMKVADRIALAAGEALTRTVPVTHVGMGRGMVKQVASNRRILGPDGRVAHIRWSASTDPAMQEYPDGLIDPYLKMVSLWNEDQAIAALSYYAVHPQSYYRTGLANSDFPGMARDSFSDEVHVPLLHFNGAAGNITAGKYNDGAHENRKRLADRVQAGMKEAWSSTHKFPLDSKKVRWKVTRRSLPISKSVVKEELLQILADTTKNEKTRFVAANKLAWLESVERGDGIDISCLSLGDVRILNLPGELFVEYQLFAQEFRQNQFVCMASYGDYGPAYIGTEISYAQGGYETGPDASFVAPEVEQVLQDAIQELLTD